MINEHLNGLSVAISDLKYDPNNVRTHGDRNITAVKESLSRFGQQKPVVALRDGTVIAGNATLQSATSLGWTHVAVSYFDGTQEEATAYAITDNRSSELADWLWAPLSEQLKDLDQHFDLDALGWGEEDIEPLFNGNFDPADFNDLSDDSPVELPDVYGTPLKLTKEQREVIDRAIEKVREINGDQTISEGRAVELICGDYIAGA